MELCICVQLLLSRFRCSTSRRFKPPLSGQLAALSKNAQITVGNADIPLGAAASNDACLTFLPSVKVSVGRDWAGSGEADESGGNKGEGEVHRESLPTVSTVERRTARRVYLQGMHVC